MNLVIDIGNTLIKIGSFINGQLTEVYTFELEQEALEFIKEWCPNYIIVSSVKKNLESFLKEFPPTINVIKLSHKTLLPIKNLYASPETLGMDRIAAVVGAKVLYPKANCLVIDAGTCITYDMIDENNAYHGGSISPGLRMRYEALHTFTNKLPLVENKNIDYFIGKTTQESILSGVVNGLTFEIEGFIQRYFEEFSHVNIIMTGGDAYSFESRIKPHIFVIPNLLLLGLNEILQFNLSNTSA